MKNTYKLEFKLFFGSTSAWIGILVLLVTGFAGLYFGNTFIDKQKEAIEKAAVLQQKNTQNNVEHFGNDIGLFFFHNKFSMANVPQPWAAFANGQRDVNPYLISATMLALEGQIYDTEITNPVSLLFGNMDLSFVFIYLFPLVIIALVYNLIAEERESGIWPLLKSQTNQLSKLIWKKFMVRTVAIYLTSIILLLASVLYLHLPTDQNLLAVTVFIWLYLAFWFAVSFFVISLSKSSSYNASVLVALWVLLCVVLPASLNLVLTQKYSVPEALQNVINQREGYHEKWDMPKEVTMKPFFEHYPQLQHYPFPADKTFSWFWYYGMQQMGDDQAVESRKAVAQKLKLRQHFTSIAALFLPTIQTQLGINEVAGTDLNAHIAFQVAYRSFHEKTRLQFYPAIFLENGIETTKVSSTKLEAFTPGTTKDWTRLVSLSLLTILFLALTLRNLREIQIVK